MGGLKEFSIAISRIVLGILVLIGGLIVLDIFVYLSATGSTFSDRVEAAFSNGYDQGYAQTYDVGYREASSEAYDKGYNKGYEINLGSGSEEEVGRRVELRNPTYKELREFLAADKTDSNLFISGEYVCFDFATELNNNAETNGIRAAYVRIRFEEWAHAVVAFETVDRGIIFIEPQSDMQVELVIGRPYSWWQFGASSPLHYSEPVLETQLIW